MAKNQILQKLLNVWQSWLPIFSKVNTTLGFVQILSWNHLNAFNNGTDGVAKGAAST